MELDDVIRVREAHENKKILEAFAKSKRLKLADVAREAFYDFMVKHNLLPLEENPNGAQPQR